MEPSIEFKQTAPEIGAEQIQLLQKLLNASGVSGDEGEVRAIVLEEVKPVADEVKVDSLGNVLVTRRGKGENRLRVMLDAHMDEVGFIVTADDGDGLFQFSTVGGIDVRQIVGKPVLIGKDHVPGVIGARAIHLTTAEERRRVIPLDMLRMDVGLGDAGKQVKLGDRAVFASRFSQVGASLRGKALDDRLGVATLIELVKHAPEQTDLLAVFSTQEEVGGWGAKVAAFQLNPDLAIAVDSTPAYDLPAWDDGENTIYNTRLGAGPAIYTMDRATLSDPRLVRFLAQTAEANQIPFQYRQPGGGGTDAGVIHMQKEGIPSVSVSVPGRYAHTAFGLARLSDWENTLKLLYLALAGLSSGFLDEIR
ncbi:MAG: M20/M25/M40 family metallo-hydrolase [Chloroflexi bacterium]|nr:M20/M25/M40 family metallo-hydrolase [Chloroflexota bacterium]